VIDEYPNDREAELRVIGFSLTDDSLRAALSADLFWNPDGIRDFRAARDGELPQFDDVAIRYGVSGAARLPLEDGADLHTNQALNELQRLRSLSKRRQIIKEAKQAIVDAQDLQKTIEVSVGSEFFEVDDVLEKIEEEARIRAETGGIKFGFDLIDRITGGCSMGQLITIIATNGTYKTTLMQNMMQNALMVNEVLNSVFFSMEMGADDEGRREILSVCRTGSLKALAWEIHNAPEEWSNTKEKYKSGHLSRMHRIYKAMTLPQIEATISSAKKKYGDGLRLVGIDYMDFIKTPGLRGADRVDLICNGLKQIGKKLGVVILLLVQVDKRSSVTQYEKGEPVQKELTRFDALGGQAISNASDMCIVMWREGEEVVGKVDKSRSPHDPDLVNPYFRLIRDAKNYIIEDLEILH